MRCSLHLSETPVRRICAGAVGTPAYLRAAAQVLARESCGEPWLLQHKVQDMDLLEYRYGCY